MKFFDAALPNWSGASCVRLRQATSFRRSPDCATVARLISSTKAELPSTQVFPANLTSGRTESPPRSPHSRRESSRRAAPLFKTMRRHRAGRPRPTPMRALVAKERQVVLDLLREPRFVDLAPAEVYASLLDQGVYLCSIRTMYRVLAEHDEVRERRRQLRRPVYQKPELLAEGPNQVWSWDITKLMGPAKWSYFYLYVIIDIFSRRIVAWCIADAESAVQTLVRRRHRQA